MTATDSLSEYNYERLAPEQTAHLLQRQQALQEEAQLVLQQLDLLPLLSRIGTVRRIGSSTLGLMVWRDIDLGVTSPGLDIESAYESVRPLYTHPQVRRVMYLNESGLFNPSAEAQDERYYISVYYVMPAGAEWKIDISFWLGAAAHVEPVQDLLEQELTPETQVPILWIKDIWHRLPTYRTAISSVDIYDAVLHHGVRTPSAFDAYLVQHNKPPRA